MTKLSSVNVQTIALEPWDAEGLEVLEGDPQTHGMAFHEEGPDGGFGPGGFAVGVYEQEPCKTAYRLQQNETVHVLKGDILIELDDGSSVELGAGDVAVLPKGRHSTWTFRATTRVFFVLSDVVAKEEGR
jgi:uncharacterized cupin superfamily protein